MKNKYYYNIWEEYKLSSTQKVLVENLLPVKKRMSKELKLARENVYAFIIKELWSIENYKQADFHKVERLGEDYIFEFILFYRLLLQETKTLDEFITLLKWYRTGYQVIRSIRGQLYGLEQVDEKYLTKIYKELIIDLKLLDFFKLFFEDKLELWTNIYKANTNAT